MGTSPLLPERSEGKEGWHVSAQPRRDGVVISEGQSQLCREDKATWGHLHSYLSEAKERRGGTSRLSRDETGWSFFGPIPAIRSKSSGAMHPAGFPLLSGVWLRNIGTKRHLPSYLSEAKERRGDIVRSRYLVPSSPHHLSPSNPGRNEH
jgi:hypothetical protein